MNSAILAVNILALGLCATMITRSLRQGCSRTHAVLATVITVASVVSLPINIAAWRSSESAPDGLLGTLATACVAYIAVDLARWGWGQLHARYTRTGWRLRRRWHAPGALVHTPHGLGEISTWERIWTASTPPRIWMRIALTEDATIDLPAVWLSDADVSPETAPERKGHPSHE